MFEGDRQIFAFGGTFGPPTTDHVLITLACTTLVGRLFFPGQSTKDPSSSLVVVVPAGDPPYKRVMVPASHRFEMCRLAFGPLQENGYRIEIDKADLCQNTYSTAVDIQERWQTRGQVVHVVGTDWVQGGAKGLSKIQTTWKDGLRIWNEFIWLVLSRAGFEITPEDLPPNAVHKDFRLEGRSTNVRELLAQGKSITGLVPPAVEKYILKNKLYRTT